MQANSLLADETVIEAGRTGRNYWRDMWQYRELFFILAWRDVTVRYKQTVAGAAWAMLQPVVSMLVATVIFGRVAGLPSEHGAPYAVMVFAAMLPWQFFANTLSSVSQSVVGNASLVSKVYFPRLIIPASSVVVALVDLCVASTVLVGLMAWFQFWPIWSRLFALPFLIVLTIVAALGPSLIATALIVRYRDFRFIVPFIINFGLYLSPVAYSSTIVRERLGDTWFLLYSMNPMVGVIDGFRWAVLGGPSNVYWPGFAASMSLAFALMTAGVAYFRKTERRFADHI